MMEIKYRAWDNLQGGKFEYWDANTNQHEGIFWEMVKGKSFEPVEQFTGFPDKNGKEIYEKHILRGKLIHKGGHLPTIGVVEYSEEFGAFGLRNEGGLTLFHNHIIPDFEIVGNKYENPELYPNSTIAEKDCR